MPNLSELTCEACQLGADKVSEQEMKTLSQDIPLWDINDVNGIKQLERVFKFKNFKSAMAFSNSVGDLAELEFHHPGILTEWGKVTVTWWSHSIKGLHKNDFIMAAKTDSLYQ